MKFPSCALMNDLIYLADIYFLGLMTFNPMQKVFNILNVDYELPRGNKRLVAGDGLLYILKSDDTLAISEQGDLLNRTSGFEMKSKQAHRGPTFHHGGVLYLQ
jgi:hypothetical protein